VVTPWGAIPTPPSTATADRQLHDPGRVLGQLRPEHTDQVRHDQDRALGRRSSMNSRQDLGVEREPDQGGERQDTHEDDDEP
jgi:hypothetical protein